LADERAGVIETSPFVSERDKVKAGNHISVAERKVFKYNRLDD
jgi:hypothetical protein